MAPPNASFSQEEFDRVHPSEGMKPFEKEALLPLTGWQQEVEQALRLGHEAADRIADRFSGSTSLPGGER